MKLLLQENFSAGSGDFGVNLFRMQTDDVQVLKYRLATDESGKVFEMCAANAMKKTLGQRAARNILDKIEHAEKKAEEAGDPETVMTKADTALKERRDNGGAGRCICYGESIGINPKTAQTGNCGTGASGGENRIGQDDVCG